MMTVADIFDAFKGPAAIGRAIGKSTEHAASMRRRASIPVRYWPRLINAARAAGIDGINHETLTQAHSAAEAASAHFGT
jgi:hypothetical protein